MHHHARFDIWIVAAAILAEHGELHIDDLTAAILRSGLATLGMKGNTPPRQTVTSRISIQPEIFYNEPRGSGFWGLWNAVEIEDQPAVADCLKLIRAAIASLLRERFS